VSIRRWTSLAFLLLILMEVTSLVWNHTPNSTFAGSTESNVRIKAFASKCNMRKKFGVPDNSGKSSASNELLGELSLEDKGRSRTKTVGVNIAKHDWEKLTGIKMVVRHADNSNDEIIMNKNHRNIRSPGPDLVIEDIWWVDAYGNTVTSVTSGQPFTFWFKVKNVGDATAYSFYVRCYFGIWQGEAYIDSLSAGSYVNVYAENVSFSSIGYHSFRAIADYYNDVAESDESNNERTESLYVNKAKWTVLVYLDGDNNLEAYTIDDFEDLASVGSTSDVSIVVQFDRILGEDSSYGDWTYCMRFFVTNGLQLTFGNRLQIYAEDSYYDGSDIDCDGNLKDEVDMGDGNVLRDFLTWGVDHFKADYYLIILENHGGSWAGCCWDDTNGKDKITLPELRDALSAVKNNISKDVDVLLFDACLMGSVEVIAEIHDYVSYAVVSETVSWTSSFPYYVWGFWDEGIIEHLKNNPTITPETLALDAVDLAEPVDDSTHVTQAIAAYDFTDVYDEWLVSDMDQLSYYLIEYFSDYKSDIVSARDACEEMEGPYANEYNVIDLYQLADYLYSYVSQSDIRNWASWIKIDINNLVIKLRYTSSASFCHGVSIYFPDSRSEYYYTYGSSGAFVSETRWDEFLEGVYYDDTPPSGLSIIINGDATYTNTTTVTLSLSASDDGYGVKEMRFSNDGINWSDWEPYTTTRTWILTSGDGTKYVYFEVKDYAGNIAGPTYDTIVLDTQAPYTSYSFSGSSYNGWYLDYVDVYLSASDSTSGVYRIYYKYYKQGGTPPSSWSYISGSSGSFTLIPNNGTGTYVVVFYAKDNAGNKESARSFTVKIDNSAPTSYHSCSGILGDNGWYTSEVSVTITASDTGVGVRYIEYYVDGTWRRYYGDSVTFAVSGDGTHNIKYYAVDYLGHAESEHELTIKIDTDPPEQCSFTTSGALGDNGWYVSIVYVAIDSDDATSGLAYIRYSINNGSWNTYSDQIELKSTGIYTIEAYAVDNAGNEGPHNQITIKIDRDSPTTSISLYGYDSTYEDWYSGTVTISFTASDIGSGVSITYYMINESDWQVYDEPISISMTGVYYIYYKSVDEAGNEETERQFVLKIDNKPPCTWITYVPSTVGTNTFTIEFEYEDQHSGFDHAELYYRVNGGDWIFYGNFSNSPIMFNAPFEGTYYLLLVGVDRLGNKEEKDIYDAEVLADFSPPIILILSPPNASYTNNTTFLLRWNATDHGSGLSYLEIYLNGSLIINTTESIGEHSISVSDVGWYEITLYAYDHLGHGSSSRVFVYVDYIEPFIAISYPVDNEIYNASKLNVSWVAYDNESGYVGAEIYVNSSLVASVNNSVFNYKLNLTADGWYIISVRAYDKAGNTATASVKIGIDAYPPVIIGLSPANHTVTGNNTLNIHVDVYDFAGIDYVIFELDSVLIGTDYEAPYETTVDLSSTEEGLHIVRITVADKTSHIRTVSLVIYVDRTPPRIHVSGIENDSVVCGVIEVHVTVDENLWLKNVTILLDSVTIYNSSANQFTFKLYTENFSDGEHILVIYAFDCAENKDIKRLNIIIDNDPPEIILVSPENNSWFSYNVTLKMHVSDATNITLMIYLDDELCYNTTLIGGSIEVLIDLRSRTEGRHRILIVSKDSLNNTASLGIDILVDKTAPTIYVEENITIHELPLELLIDAQDNFAINTLIVFLDNDTTIVAEYNDIGLDSITINISISKLSPGEHMVIIRTADYAGNTVEKIININYIPPRGLPDTIVVMILVTILAIIVVAYIIRRRRRRYINF